MKLLIVDDHPLVRKGIISTLSFEEKIEEIKEASNIAEAMNIIGIYRPEIVIVDLRLGKESGLDLISQAKSKKYTSKFMVLTSSIQREDFEKAKEIGVDGYILKEAFAEDILYAFHVVARGKKFIDPELMGYETEEEKDTLSGLTPREKDVLNELGKGLSNLDIAKKLFISEHTVKKHVSNILSKLELSHRTQAALFVNNNVKVG